MFYILALEPFLRKLRANLVQHSITLPGASTTARYSTYGDDVSILETSSAEMEKVSKEIKRYEDVTGTKINHKTSVGLQLGS